MPNISSLFEVKSSVGIFLSLLPGTASLYKVFFIVHQSLNTENYAVDAFL